MILLFFPVLLSFCGPSGPAELSYNDGRYIDALKLFETALSESGTDEGAILYNMGNCAYRLGRHAEAVLFYKRALLRMPRDPQAVFNLRMAEQQLGIDASAVTIPFGTAVTRLADRFTGGELLVLVNFLQGIGLLGLLLTRGCFTRIIMLLLLLLGLSGAARLVQAKCFPGPPEGVVIAEEIALRIEPHADLAVTHELKAGETVHINEMSDRWARITHSQGSGWTERAGIGVVD